MTFSVLDPRPPQVGGNPPTPQVARRYAIGAKEVSEGEFESGLRGPLALTGPPRKKATWYEAAEFCNRMNALEDIPKEEWFYVPDGSGRCGPGMTVASATSARRGYRLPTLAEWRYAHRAGAATRWHCGVLGEVVLAHYAWFRGNRPGSEAGPFPTARLKPNDFGLFDTHGNMAEWLHPDQEVSGEQAVAPVMIGGGYNSLVIEIDDTHTTPALPGHRYDDAGFRLVRVFPAGG
jgi:hypothetical protein